MAESSSHGRSNGVSPETRNPGTRGRFSRIAHAKDALSKRGVRLLRELNGGAWCPAPQISSQTHEYLEVNLRSVHVLTSLATQGRFGNGQGREFAEEFMVEYWRPGLHKWLRYRNRTHHEVRLYKTPSQNTIPAAAAAFSMEAKMLRFGCTSENPRWSKFLEPPTMASLTIM
ncbi:hypothetical protein HPB51_017612 [Rhipicephalus microplus]|uniref:F5/8 type C domain-containing protein n=1 Tax=Rhipicephalus microplus TaxID=6941 RepID=A0A9J6EHV7_RHIMP|nr:hypothetical protein HPB51_017612 [Rhipicephalus microplus]